MIRLSKCSLGASERVGALRALNNEYLGMGSIAFELEDQLTTYLGRETVCVSSGTAAIQLALEAIDVGVGSEVILPSITYVAAFQAVSATGATAVACDVDRDTLKIDLKSARGLITERTKAIMPMHYGGSPVDPSSLERFRSDTGLRVIEDAAHAFGSKTDEGDLVGSIGDIVCFSFDGIKNITCGEGGCIASSDSRVLSRIRDKRFLGVERDTEARKVGDRSWDFDVRDQGWRYHMSDIFAGIGIAQLERREWLANRRQSLASHYVESISHISWISPVISKFHRVVPHIFSIVLSDDIDRSRLKQYLEGHGIQTGIHYKPCHTLSRYKSSQRSGLPNSEGLYNQLLTLPLHPDLSHKDVDYVVQRLREYQ